MHSKDAEQFISLPNGWTGGQYSLFRILLGIYLFVHTVILSGRLLRIWQSPLINLASFLSLDLSLFGFQLNVSFLLACAVLAAFLSLLLVVGLFDRAAAIVLALLLLLLPLRATPEVDVILSHMSRLFLCCLLFSHSLHQANPWGALSNKLYSPVNYLWKLSSSVFADIWLLLCFGYLYLGLRKIVFFFWLDKYLSAENARGFLLSGAVPSSVLAASLLALLCFELSFPLLVISRRFRPRVWFLMLIVQLLFTLFFAAITANIGLFFLHLLAFDPAWLKAQETESSELVLYDSQCSLCQGFIRFLLSEDRRKNVFRFSPQGSSSAKQALSSFSENAETDLSPSMLLLSVDNKLLKKGAALLYILRHLGGLWTVTAELLQLIPLSVLDRFYGFVAHSRYRFFGEVADSCSTLPPEFAARFSE